MDEITVFAPMRARPGMEEAVIAAMRGVAAPTRAEPGCLELGYHRSVRDPRVFYVFSRWRDLAAFERHATLPHTVRFIDEVERALEHPVEAVRTRRLDI